MLIRINNNVMNVNEVSNRIAVSLFIKLSYKMEYLLKKLYNVLNWILYLSRASCTQVATLPLTGVSPRGGGNGGRETLDGKHDFQNCRKIIISC